MRESIRRSDVVMLARHGSVTVGPDLSDAFKKLEKLEHNAAIMIYARILGGPKPFSQGQLRELQGLRDFYGITTQQIACSTLASPEEIPTASPAGSRRGSCRNRDVPLDQRELDALVDEIVARVKQQL